MAEAFQEPAVRGLFRKGLDEEVPSSREADIEQPARFFVSFSPQINNALVPFEIDVIDFKRQDSSASFVFVCPNPMVQSEARNLAKLE